MKAIVKYLSKDAQTPIQNIRLNPTVNALMKAGFLANMPAVNATSILIPTYVRSRNGGISVSEFTGFFDLNCGTEWSNAMKPMERGFAAKDMAFLTDGFCGSSCGNAVRSLRDTNRVRTLVYGAQPAAPTPPPPSKAVSSTPTTNSPSTISLKLPLFPHKSNPLSRKISVRPCRWV
ncbi:hypothetical protein BC829DRAFT_19237 [Chytridium lagenaria]|nr:hypothetical protein BC829DRAFT_19237 [Chytridium lagenaria]